MQKKITLKNNTLYGMRNAEKHQF